MRALFSALTILAISAGSLFATEPQVYRYGNNNATLVRTFRATDGKLYAEWNENGVQVYRPYVEYAQPTQQVDRGAGQNPFVSNAVYNRVRNATVRYSVHTGKTLPSGKKLTPTGTGTIVAVRENIGVTEIAVLTCWHTFSDGEGRTWGSLPGGVVAEGTPVKISVQDDLCLLMFKTNKLKPEHVQTVSLSDKYVTTQASDANGEITAVGHTGYGREGTFYCGKGEFVGYTSASHAGNGESKSVPQREDDLYKTGQTQLQITGNTILGDSGGGIYNARGELVGVLWGSPGGYVYGTSVPVVRKFVNDAPEWMSSCDRCQRPPRGNRRPPRIAPVEPPIEEAPEPGIVLPPIRRPPRVEIEITPKEEKPPVVTPPDNPPKPDCNDHKEINKRLDEIAGKIGSSKCECDTAAVQAELEKLRKAIEELKMTGGSTTGGSASLDDKLIKELIIQAQRANGGIEAVKDEIGLSRKDHAALERLIKELGMKVQRQETAMTDTLEGLEALSKKLDDTNKNVGNLQLELQKLTIKAQRTHEAVETFTKAGGAGKIKFKLRFDAGKNTYVIEPTEE